MPMADWILWLMGAGTILVIGLLVYWAWRALFKDRANGGRRCPRCWYDMAYSPGMTCGECGFTAKHEGQFGKTRRRYGQAAAAILSCAGITLWLNYQISPSNWPTVMPTKLLILSMPFADPDGNVYGELRKRMLVDRISDYELSMFLKRCANGDWWARPPGSASEQQWIEKYGHQLNLWRRSLVLRGEVTGYDRRAIDVSSAPYTEHERLLFEIPPSLHISMPRQWPTGVQPRVQIQMQHWWPAGSEARLRIQIDDDPQQVILKTRGRSRVRGGVALDGIQQADADVTLRVAVDRRRPGLGEPWQPVSSHIYTLPVEVTDQLDTWPQALRDEAITELLRNVFQGHAVKWQSGIVPVRFRYDPSPARAPALDDVGIGVILQLRRDDVVARQLNIWWRGGITDRRRDQPNGLGWEVAYEDEKLLAELTSDDDRWHFYIEGRPELAVLAGDVEKYWAGSFTAPLRLSIIESESPAPEWQRADEE